jgi:hypothetical protein
MKTNRERKRYISNSRTDPDIMSFKEIGETIGVSLGRASVIFNGASEKLAFEVFVELNGFAPTTTQVAELAQSEAWNDMVRGALQKKVRS